MSQGTQKQMQVRDHAHTDKPLVERFGERYGVDAGKVLGTLAKTVFRIPGTKKKPAREPSNEEMMALLIVADQHQLNPFTKEIYAFPDEKGGIIPIVSVDGWTRIIQSHPKMEGIEFRYADEMEQPDDDSKRCPVWCEAIIYRSDRKHPTVVREYLDEVYRPAFQGKGENGPYKIKGPWQSHTKRMLRHKTLIQGARVAFGFSGIYDEDEAERIHEAQQQQSYTTEEAPGASDLMPKEKGANVVQLHDAATMNEEVVDAEFVADQAQEGSEAPPTPEAEPEPAPQPQPEPPPAPAPEPPHAQSEAGAPVAEGLNPGMLNVLIKKIASKGISDERVTAHFGVQQLKDIPKAKINEALQFVADADA